MTQHRAPWGDAPTAGGHAPLVEDLEVDVAIVGAGITGLSLAMKLQAAGFQVAVLDRDRVASG
ncbi:MAG TPA: FAD-dependent oxidoreductase, partial [Polyangiaceae bacterium LLY-WYZ-14_1]|nr:FAD-dependent oxidoreductase [Polyangiaceae bacterium LLY-WYZ-14_1]